MIATFLFYDIAQGAQSILAFSKEFKHCGLVMFDGEHSCLYSYNKAGIKTQILKAANLNELINSMKRVTRCTGIVSVEIIQPANIWWKPLMIRSCNEIARYLSGIDIGLTANPRHLYNKLLKYHGKRNYELLYAWRRSNGVQQR